MAVLETLGNPNKEYHRGQLLFLNYIELGVDIAIETTGHTVYKFVLHTNSPRMPNFCVYDRCNFELELKRVRRIPRDQKEESKHQLFEEADKEEFPEEDLKNSTTLALEEHLKNLKQLEDHENEDDKDKSQGSFEIAKDHSGVESQEEGLRSKV